MTTVPPDLLYSTDHEWVRLPETGDIRPGGGSARIGVTEFAADELGDVVFLDLPSVGAKLVAGEQCGEIESTKSVSPLYSPVSGTVTAVNRLVIDEPELVNQAPFGDGWLFEATVSGTGDLLDPDGYAALVAQR
jgi:glycine cleavage system H protein